MSNNSDYVTYFLASRSSAVQYDTLELSHPNFTRTYFVVRNKTSGLTATLETGDEVEFEYVPMRIRGTDVRENLDYGVSVIFGDLGEILQRELDAVRAANGTTEVVNAVYRTYSSENLSSPLFGPIELIVKQISFSREGATFDAGVPALNDTGTGEKYDPDRFVPIKGFL